jgi:hypothetical protein
MRPEASLSSSISAIHSCQKKRDAVAAGDKAQVVPVAVELGCGRPLDEPERMTVEEHVAAEGTGIGNEEVIEVFIVDVAKDEAAGRVAVFRIEGECRLQGEIAILVQDGRHPGEMVFLPEFEGEGVLFHQAGVGALLHG